MSEASRVAKLVKQDVAAKAIISWAALIIIINMYPSLIQYALWWTLADIILRLVGIRMLASAIKAIEYGEQEYRGPGSEYEKGFNNLSADYDAMCKQHIAMEKEIAELRAESFEQWKKENPNF